MAEDIVKARITFDKPGKGLFGAAGGAGAQRSKSEVQKDSKNVGVIASGVALANVALAAISKATGALVQASPRLAATFKILGKT